MNWDLSTECTALIFLLIILIFSREGHLAPTLKNKMFSLCLYATLGSITSNLISTYYIYKFEVVPYALVCFFLAFYFIMISLVAVTFYYYTVSIAYDGNANIKKPMILGAIPMGIYMVILIINFFTGGIYSVDPILGYIQGPYLFLTYANFYIYAIACILLVVFRWKYLDISVRKTLLYFAVLAAIVVIIQQCFPTVILSGSAATCALLIIYLNLQNKQISVDYLTGLLNRQEFLKMMELRLHDKSNPFSILVFSINNFKLVNDKFGQSNGDLILKQTAKRIKEIVKTKRVYRFGGDQFAILFDGDSYDDEKKLIEKIAYDFNKPFEVGRISYPVSFSIGGVKVPLVAKNMEDIINGIEYSLSDSKKNPHKLFSFCTTEMLNQIRRKGDIIEILNERIASNGFEVYFQPIWSVKEKRFIYAEALLRLKDTPLGDLSPGEFIPIAEESGQIIEMTYLVLEKVCQFIKGVLRKGGDIKGVSINMPFIQITQRDVKKRILSIIQRYDLPCSKIKIEITEGALIADFELVKNFIEEMQAEDIRFGLDDFGTGYSNISSVLNIPFQTIKLDKSLITSSFENPRSEIFMIQITKAIEEMGMLVLAEGVETEEQRIFVENCHCGCIQGYYFAYPSPRSEAEQFFLPKE